MILGSFDMKLTIVDPPIATRHLVGVAKLRALEVIGESGADTWVALRGAGSDKNTEQHRR
jgi:hypothetical protein